MTKRISKLGYCRDCRKNVMHVHCFVTSLGYWWGWLVGRRLTALRWGHWHCPVCTRDCYWLPRPRDDVGELRPDSAPRVEVERISNHLYDHVSLVARQERATRFTPKFRESVVDRLLSGSVSMLQVRQELGVSDSDLMAWIAEKLQHQSQRIEQLSTALRQISERNPVDDSSIFDWGVLSVEDASVVEGVARQYDREPG